MAKKSKKGIAEEAAAAPAAESPESAAPEAESEEAAAAPKKARAAKKFSVSYLDHYGVEQTREYEDEDLAKQFKAKMDAKREAFKKTRRPGRV